MRIAFYAPTVATSHNRPSGDRRMAELLIAALSAAGHQVMTASTLRSYHGVPDDAALPALMAQAEGERSAIAYRFTDAGIRPDLWFTYHPYYKAPDLIGPDMAALWRIPYVTAEASFAGKRAKGVWAGWHAASLPALSQAACHFVFSARDRAGLAAFGMESARLVDLLPFIDTTPFRQIGALTKQVEDRIELVTVAMMRGGRKLESYRHLARALALLDDIDWRLTICGDGLERAAVEQAFAGLPAECLRFLGQVSREALPETLASADLFVWPGIGEAYGLCYLEAQAVGLPCIAYASGGVAASIDDGRTGLLAAEGDIAGLAGAIHRLAEESSLRRIMAGEARRLVHEGRSVEAAASRLASALARLAETDACIRMPA